MDLAALVSQYGYWMVALGCFFEGETTLVLAGFAAHQGYLRLPAVLALAALAATAGDQCFFWLGRRHGDALIERFPKLAANVPKLHALLRRHDAWLIVGLRFAYGLRMAGPIVLGTTSIPGPRFVLFNLLGAVLWAAVIGTIGWFVGAAAERVLGELRHLEVLLFVGIALAGALVWWIRR